MDAPIVIAYHLIWTAYGWWLPNDIRGSTSKFICSDVIFELGNLRRGRKKVQPARGELLEFFYRAAGKLKFDMVEFGAAEVLGIAGALRHAIALHRYTCYACAIMPDHVHILIRKHKHLAEEMIANFQEATRQELRRLGLREPDHPVWGGPGWKVFLDHPDEIRRTIPYVEENPIKIRRPPQAWDFVTEYDGWPLHPGHSPNSPYARRMRGRGA
jgi:hypothetical protein